MRVVVGLGNPGPEYEGTRHNVGFEVADRLARRLGLAFRRRDRDADVADGRDLPGAPCAIVKPMSFMNLSGEPLRRVLRDLDARPEDCLVVLDDFQLDLGRIRLRRAGSDGGHNGLRSVIERLGTQRIPRLRIGIGPPPARLPAEVFVLRPFGRSEREEIEHAIERAVDIAEQWVRGGDLEELMRRANAPPPP